ncbi:MAG: methyltransferase domain-containing protein [Verrucomicrobiota bacterium]
MYEFHRDKQRYFEMQRLVTQHYVIPFLEGDVDLSGQLDVLEIGCAEAGVLSVFIERGDRCTGVELDEKRYQQCLALLSKEITSGQARIINRNIFDVIKEGEIGRFDLIILKDVIEHIEGQEELVAAFKGLLKEDGCVFFGFPPWWMPFGGHQQVCRNKLLSVLPWFHLLPVPLYRGLLNLAKEPKEEVVDDLLQIKRCGITIERMERILKDTGYSVLKRTPWFINPIYRYKFGFKPIKLWSLFASIPWLRNVYTTALYISFKPR